MRKTMTETTTGRRLTIVAAAGLAFILAQAPAEAGSGAISSFKVRNCTSERIFVCSFDKTDSLMKIPYSAKGVQPTYKKEFSCASLGKCKVIIGVSRKKKKKGIVPKVVEVGMGAGAIFGGAPIGAATAAGVAAAVGGDSVAVASAAMGGLSTGSSVFIVGAALAIGSLEVADGWSAGKVCDKVRQAAKKAGYKPKHFLKDGKVYTVIPQYVTDKNGNPYVNPDGTAVFTYVTKKGKSCPAPLKTQLIPN